MIFLLYIILEVLYRFYTKFGIVSEFLKVFAHHCINAGAHAIVGHGPHLLRPIEVYKDCPIFYSLGDFILQLYNVEIAPEDFFAKHGLTSEATVHQLMKNLWQNGNIDYGIAGELGILPSTNECSNGLSDVLLPDESYVSFSSNALTTVMLAQVITGIHTEKELKLWDVFISSYNGS